MQILEYISLRKIGRVFMRRKSFVIFLCLALLLTCNSLSGYLPIYADEPRAETAPAYESQNEPGKIEQNQEEQDPVLSETPAEESDDEEAGTEAPSVESSSGSEEQTEGELEQSQQIAAPCLVRAAANSDGTIITVSFSEAMDDPSGLHSQFSVRADNLNVVVLSAALNEDERKIDLALQEAVNKKQTVYVSYTAGGISSAAGGLLDSFADEAVAMPEDDKVLEEDAETKEKELLQAEEINVPEFQPMMVLSLMAVPGSTHHPEDWNDSLLGGGMPGVSAGDTIILPDTAIANTTLTVPVGISGLTLQGSCVYTGLSIELASGHPGLALTIQDLNLTAPDEKAGIDFGNATGACSLIILGSNNIRGGSSYAGVQVPEGCSLIIDGSGTLTAIGSGDLGGAGIGGAGGFSGGTITILDGTIEARGGQGGAGIGGGCAAARGADVIISGGNITAAGGDDGSGDDGGAGVGGGSRTGDYGTVIINGGTVIANGGSRGAGIGGGDASNDGGSVTINDGNVTASGKDGGAGIGAGYGCGDSGVIINGGTIQANGSDGAAGIGGGNKSSAVSLTINDGNISATGGSRGAGIGSGASGGTGAVIILSGSVIAQGGENSAGIGSGYKGGAMDLTISGGIIKAIGGTSGAGIGSGNTGGGADAVVNGGQIEAIGGAGAQDIGSGVSGTAGSLTVNGWAIISADDVITASGSSGPYTIRLLNTTGTSAGVQTVTLKTGAGEDCVSGKTGSDSLFGSLYLKNNTDYQVAVTGFKIHKSGDVSFQQTAAFTSGTAAATLDFVIANTPTVTDPPFVDTIAASSTQPTTAAVTAQDKGYEITARGVVYSSEANPTLENGTAVPASLGIYGTGFYAVQISGLTPSTTYHVRAYATNEKGTSYGEDLTFTTDSDDCVWSDISANLPASAQGNTSLLDMKFISDNEGWIVQSGTGSANIYHTTDGGLTFTTIAPPAEASSGVTAIHMLNQQEGFIGCQNGKIYRTIDGGDSWTAVGSMGPPLSMDFAPGSNTGFACGDAGKIYQVTATGIQAMSSGTSQNVRSICATGESRAWCTSYPNIRHYDGSAWAEIESAPSESYQGIDMLNDTVGWAVGTNGIIVHTDTGGVSVNDQWGFDYQSNADSEQRDLRAVAALSEGEAFAVGIEGAVLHTVDGGATWNPEAQGMTTNMMNAVCFTSPTNGYALGNKGTLLKYGPLGGGGVAVPAVATGAVTNIITSGATVAGNVTSDGGSAVTERGIVYSGLANPTLDNASKAVAATTGTGEFSVNITGLMSGTIAHARAYATNSQGTSYGEDVSFTTATVNGLTVTTGDITDISSKGARVGGYAIPGKLAGIIERGVVYSTSANPTVNDFKVPYTANALEGPILVNLTYLNPNTTYHVRAYAIDSQNIAVYGEDKVFTSAADTYSWTDLSVNLPANARLDPDLPDNAQGATTMMAMDFIDANNGWLALTRYANNQPVNELLITHNGGATFQVVPAPAVFYSISFKSASEGLAAGNDGRIYRTLDGGLTWRNAGSGVKPYYAVTYPKGSDSGYACGNWMRLSRVKPVDPVTGNETGLETMPREEGISGWSENLNCISFVPSGDGWEGWAGGAEAIIHWTGSEWRADGTMPSSDVSVNGNGGSHNGICMVNHKEGWCVMDFGFILHTNNNGQEWTIQASPEVFKIGINAYGPQRTLMDVDFLNNQEGWAVGSKGVVLHTVDGGMSWNIEVQGMTNRMMTSVKAISPTCGYALGNNGSFLKYGPLGEPVITAPTVNTGTISGVSDTLASVAGNVTSDGGSAVSERGVVFSTSADPTIDNGTKVAADAAGTGEFSVNLAGLNAETTYHVRAFATNSIGTSYGLDKTFTTGSTPVEVISVSLNKSETTISAGLEEQLTAKVLPENASDKSVVWTIESESDEGVLTVANGLISAKKPGSSVVRATSVSNPEAYAECTVTVNAAPQAALTGIVVTPDGVALKVNGTQPMKVTAYYSDQSTVDVTASCSYAFSVDGIASISSSGLLTAESPGNTVLTAAFQEKQDTADITVTSGGGGGGGGGGSSNTNSGTSSTTRPEVINTPLEPEVKNPAAEPSDLAGHWAHDCIIALIQHGIIKGYPDGTIRPEQEITRAEAAILLVNSQDLQNYELQNQVSPYSDELPAWAERAILICFEKGLMKGYPDGSFKPDQHITRAEMCVALINAYPQVKEPDFTLGFADKESIPDWAWVYIEAAAANQIVSGYPDNTFQPGSLIKRGEAFSIICRLKGYHNEHIS